MSVVHRTPTSSVLPAMESGEIRLHRNLLKYKQVSSVISDSALKALIRHLWYLSSESVPVALFSVVVPKPELQYLAEKMLASKPIDGMTLPRDRYGTGFGKPKFPTAITDTTRLGDLVTADSGYIVELLEIDIDFLNDDVENWPGHPSFCHPRGK